MFRGQVLNGQQLWNLIESLAANKLLCYTHLLTGNLFDIVLCCYKCAITGQFIIVAMLFSN